MVKIIVVAAQTGLFCGIIGECVTHDFRLGKTERVTSRTQREKGLKTNKLGGLRVRT